MWCRISQPSAASSLFTKQIASLAGYMSPWIHEFYHLAPCSNPILAFHFLLTVFSTTWVIATWSIMIYVISIDVSTINDVVKLVKWSKIENAHTHTHVNHDYECWLYHVISPCDIMVKYLSWEANKYHVLFSQLHGSANFPFPLLNVL